MLVKTIMKSPAITIDADAPVALARELMARTGVTLLPVVRGTALVGMLHERDMLRALPSSIPDLAAHDWVALLGSLRVSEIMERRRGALPLETSVEEAVRIARADAAAGFAVVGAGEVAGVVTTADLLAVLVRLLEDRCPTPPGPVVLVSDSPAPSRVALDRAAEVARCSGAPLVLLSVIPPVADQLKAHGLSPELLARVRKTRRASATAALEEVGASLPGVKLRMEVAEGEPASEAARVADELDAQLVVVEFPRRRRLRAFFGDPLPWKVVRLSPCPVLVVPD